MRKISIEFIYGPFSSAGKQFNFQDIYGDSSGLTGSETSCFSFATEMANRGHNVSLYAPINDCIPPTYVWGKVNVKRLQSVGFARQPPEVMYTWNEPDVFKYCPSSALRIVNQQLNDFGYCQFSDYDDYVDIYTSPSDCHRKYISQSTPIKEKWEVLGNGFDPKMFFPREKKQYSVVYASSPDRGLHILLEAWPKIKKQVPQATLDIYYDCTNYFHHITAREKNYANNLIKDPAMLEYINRGKYIIYALDKMKSGYDIIHHQAVSKKNMAEKMGQASVLAYPCSSVSFTEGFSATTIESCASGMVPIISNQDALEQIYGEVVPMVKTPTHSNIDSFITLVVKALTDKKFQEETTAKTIQFAKDYTWTKLTDHLETIIEKGLAKK